MEMTTAVSSKNKKEITQPVVCKSIPKESTHGEKDTNNSTCFNEGCCANMLCKSIEFTEIVPTSLQDERIFSTTNISHIAQSTSFSHTVSKTILLPAENSVKVVVQTDAVANEPIQDISMELTVAVPSKLHLTQDVNKTESSIISKNDEFLRPITSNNLTKSWKDLTYENFTISKEIVETENIRHNELSNVFVTPLDNLDHSLNANLKNADHKKRMSDENEKSDSKRVRRCYLEVQSQVNDVHSFPNTSANYVNDIDCNECSNSNLRDSLNEISENSFLRDFPFLENNLEELQSIKPPPFVCLDGEEENSFREFQPELQSSITDIPGNDTSNQSMNNVTESKCSINSKNTANDYFTIFREKEEPINTANNQIEDCHESFVIDKTEDNQETNCQTITKTIVNDSRLIKLNYYRTENINEESTLPMCAEDGKTVTVQDLNHCTSLIIKDIEVIDEKKCIRKRLNEDAKLQNNIKEKGQYLDKKRQETEKCSDHFEGTGVVIETQIDLDEHEKSLNEVKQQSTKQKDERAIKEHVTAQYVSMIKDVKNRVLTEQDLFLILLQKLETHAVREDCIWNVYYKNLNRKMLVFGFISNSLLIATFLSYDFNAVNGTNLIKEIKIISRISDDTGVLVKIVHKLILEKVNAEILTNLYRTHEDILSMLNFISQDVKLAMDFMFDLRRLDDLNLMEIIHDEISFISRSKRTDIILKVTIKVKRFDELTPNDIDIHCLLGRIKETDIKNLIKNVKRDHKFLRRYMNDVKDYIDIMEETFK